MGRKNEGLTEAQLQDMAQFESSAHFTDEEKDVLRFAACLTRTPAEVPDPLFASLRARFSEQALVELAAVIAWENYRSRWNRAFKVEAEGFSKGAFCPMPER